MCVYFNIDAHTLASLVCVLSLARFSMFKHRLEAHAWDQLVAILTQFGCRGPQEVIPTVNRLVDFVRGFPEKTCVCKHTSLLMRALILLEEHERSECMSECTHERNADVCAENARLKAHIQTLNYILLDGTHDAAQTNTCDTSNISSGWLQEDFEKLSKSFQDELSDAFGN